MKTRAFTTVLSVVALMLFGAAGALAQAQHEHGVGKPAQHDMSKMDMSGMMNEPHHALAMAYMQNIGTFATTLHDQAVGSGPLNVEFARAAVAEIRRSLDEMEAHHGEHMKAMSDEMRSHMAAMMKEMETHKAMIKDAVAALEKDVAADQPDSKQVAADSASLIKQLDEMSKMHDGSKGMKMKM